MRRTMTPLLVAVLVVFSAQQLLTPILAPLSRELRLTETQLGLVITVAAVALTVASPLWGRALDRLGLRTVLLTGLGLSTVGLAGFAAVSLAGLGSLGDGTTPTVTFLLMLLTRSVLFGAGIAAVPVAALAAAGTTTTTEAERTRAVGLVGAAQGVSLVLGPAAGGGLAAVSLLLPLYVAPVITAALLVWVFVTVSRVPAATAAGPRTRGVRFWDSRILPLLGIGFLLYLSLGLVQVIIGFLVADRFELDAQATAGAVSISLVAAGVVLVLAQGVLVPRLGWNPRRLLRTGTPITVVAFALLAVAPQLWVVVVSFAVLALGLGLALPGYTAAPTLVVGSEQQGSVAGLINATTGVTFVVGPTLGGALYQLDPVAPVIAAAVAAVLAWIVVWVAPAARRAAPVAVGV